MKKKIAILLLSISLLMCGTAEGCSKKIKNEYGNEVYKIGPYIEITSEKGKNINGDEIDIITVYHEQSKIVYQIFVKSYSFSIIELHDYDDEGHPVLLFYNEGKIAKKDEIYN